MAAESPADRYTILTTITLPSGHTLIASRYFWSGTESLEERVAAQMAMPGAHSVLICRTSKEEIESHLEAEYGITDLMAECADEVAN